MNQTDIIEFFDRLAPTWDENQILNEAAITKILDCSGIQKGMTVLDVACGTGVLFPHYLERGVQSVTGIDISPEMIRVAKSKFGNHPEIQLLCGDVETAQFETQFDSVMVHNAFPHFPDPKRLISRLASFTKDGGRLTIAHSLSREKINEHHKGRASRVSNGLMSAEELEKLFLPFFDVDILVSDAERYQVSGIRKAR